jgi:hypothetical protein
MARQKGNERGVGTSSGGGDAKRSTHSLDHDLRKLCEVILVDITPKEVPMWRGIAFMNMIVIFVFRMCSVIKCWSVGFEDLHPYIKSISKRHTHGLWAKRTSCRS